MLKGFIATGFFVGLIAMIFITPAKYAQGIFKLEFGELERLDKIKSWIPLYNVAKSETIYTGHISMVLLGTILFIVSFCLRLVCVFVFSSLMTVQIASITFMFLMLLFWYGANFYTVFIVLKDSGTSSIMGCIMRSMFFPLGQYYIGTYLVTVMKNSAKREAVFK